MSLLQTTSSTRQSDLLGQTTCCPEEHGDSGRTRTPNLLIRSQLLYPVELRNQVPALAGTGADMRIALCAVLCPIYGSKSSRRTQRLSAPQPGVSQFVVWHLAG